jgi:phosphatidate cytidylyltransferase
MSDDRPDEGAPSDPRPSGRIRIVGAQPATGEHPTVPADPPGEAEGGDAPVVDDPNKFGAIPVISADQPPSDPTPPRGVDTGADEPPAPAPAPSAAPDLDDLDLPATAAIPVVAPEPEPEPEPAPPPAPAPTPAPRQEPSAEDLDDIRVWAAPPDDEEDTTIEAGRSASEDHPFADLLGDEDDLSLLGPSDDEDLDLLGAEDDLPHWSEPAATPEGDDDAFAGVSGGPRWRGQGDESGEPEDFSDLAEETVVESPGEEEMIFDDTNAPAIDPIESAAGPPQRRSPYPDAPEDDGSVVTGGGGRDMQQAVIVGAALVAALLVCGLIGAKALVLLATAVVVMATAEFFTATRRAGYHPAPLVGLVGSGGLVLGAYWRGEAAIPIMLFLVVVLAMCWWLFDAGPGDHAIANLGITVFGVMWIGGLGSFAALMLRQPNGIGVFYGAVLVAVAADIGGLFVGQRMGRSPLIAASPNKTLEGFIGGILIAAVVSFLLLGVIGLFPWEPMDALILGVVGGIMTPLGDLCESRLKRDLGVKDMGQILPGHGGVLDRFDGLLFVLPATYCVWLLLEVFANVP